MVLDPFENRDFWLSQILEINSVHYQYEFAEDKIQEFCDVIELERQTLKTAKSEG